MVRTNKTFKQAFTMIELIFAIVIIAISVLSLPMVTQVTSKNMERGFAQEAIFQASAELNQALSWKWDVYSQETVGELSKVIPLSSTDCNTSGNIQRPGHIHRMCLDEYNTSIPLISAAGSNSIGGSQVTDGNISVTGDISTGSGYKELYKMDIDVDWGGDEFGVTDKDMKKIEITVKKKKPDGTYEPYVVLRTFSANIGETEAAKRTF